MARLLALLLLLFAIAPANARFVSVDPVPPQANSGENFNRYAYAANNPYKYRDPDGRFIDTVFDVGFAAYSGYQLYREPSWTNAGALGADIAAILVPGVTGAGSAVRAAGAAADVSRSTKLTPDTLIYRQGASYESPSRLNRKASEAQQSNIGIHGVSGSTSKPDGPCSAATCAQLNAAGFEVHATSRPGNPGHVTIELPAPVTKENADDFNKALGRKK